MRMPMSMPSPEPRLARRDESAALAELFGDVPMQGSLVLSTRRDPDFFALYDMQDADARCWVVERDGRLTAMAAALARDGWLAERPVRVGYLGDLRTRFSARRDRSVLRFYPRVFEEASKAHGCDLYLTGVMASNAAALHALVRRRKEREGQPVYTLLRRYSMVSIQFAGARRFRGGVTVRRATAGDLPAYVARLDADHRRRPFGYRFDAGELERRLARWPGFSLDSTFLAFRGGTLVGGATCWDPAPVKRYRVEAYRGSMRWTKRGFNAAARLLGWTPLPEPGGEFRYFYLCNLTVDDAEAMRALLETVYAEHRRRGYHFFSFIEYEDDPLARATKGFFARRLGFHLYAVTRSGAPVPEIPPGPTGFELALA